MHSCQLDESSQKADIDDGCKETGEPAPYRDSDWEFDQSRPAGEDSELS